MARARNIKPGFFRNEILGEMPVLYRLIFIGLWTAADKSGRLENRPKRLKAEIMPYEDVDMTIAIDELAKNGFLFLYSNNGKELIQINNWEKHQSPHHKEVPSCLPAPNFNKSFNINNLDNDISCMDHAQFMHESCMDDASDKKITSSPLDSLIPDSLIPDSLIPDSKEKTKPQPDQKNEKLPEENENDELPDGNDELVLDEDLDEKALIFDMGVQALTAFGMPPKSARSMIGKCVKEVGLKLTLEIVIKLPFSGDCKNPAGLLMSLLQEAKDPVLAWLKEEYGPDIRRNGKLGYIGYGRTYAPDGRREVVL